MAKFNGFQCDGTCGEDPDGPGKVYPDSMKNEVIIRFVGPQFSGEKTLEYCPTCVAAEAEAMGPLEPLKRRHRATPAAGTYQDTNAPAVAVPSVPGAPEPKA